MGRVQYPMDCLVDTAPEMDGKEQMLPLTLACFSSFSFLCLNDMGYCKIYTLEDIKLIAQICVLLFLRSSFKEWMLTIKLEYNGESSSFDTKLLKTNFTVTLS